MVPPNACRILLVRHATAEGGGRFQGQRDPELTHAGHRELRLLCKKCSQHPVRVVYASDLQRARRTAAGVARIFGLKVNLDPALREMQFGEWEGLSWNQVAAKYPRLARLWIERFPHYPIPGGEPLGKFRQRIAAAMRRIVDANQGQCALVVTHAGVIRFTLAKALGLPARNLFRLAQDSCALNVIDYFESSPVVRCING